MNVLRSCAMFVRSVDLGAFETAVTLPAVSAQGAVFPGIAVSRMYGRSLLFVVWSSASRLTGCGALEFLTPRVPLSQCQLV